MIAFESMGYLCLFFFSSFFFWHGIITFFFSHALWHVFFLSCPLAWISFLSFFSIAHTPFWHIKTLERDSCLNQWSNLFGGMENMFLRNSQCKS
jgi:hypothetical protein